MKEMKKIELPLKVKVITNVLDAMGAESFVVGGCIRDSIIGREINDWDIATSTTPNENSHIFKDYKIIEKGIDFGTISIYIENEEFELTTYRKDAETKDGRHPEYVTFAKTIEDDLSRRDFTCNAIAFNEKRGFVDPYNGMPDISNKMIRAVGNPFDRFKEDALRMIRAIRFSAQLGFTIEDETYNAIRECAYLIKNISQERFNKEITKILESDNPQNIELLYETGIAKFMFPELVSIFECGQDNPNHWRKDRITTVGEHTMDALKAAVSIGKTESVYNTLEVRMALLCHDFGKPSTKGRRLKNGFGEVDSFFGHQDVSSKITEECLKRLRYSKAFIKDVIGLVKYHDIEFVLEKEDRIYPNGSQIRKAYADFGGNREHSIYKADNLIEKLFAVRICDASAQNPDAVDGISISSEDKVSKVKTVVGMINNDDEILRVVLPINGKTVAFALGLNAGGIKTHGEFIGKVLNKIQEKVIKDNRFLDKLTEEKANDTILSYALSMGMKNIIGEEFFEK